MSARKNNSARKTNSGRRSSRDNKSKRYEEEVGRLYEELRREQQENIALREHLEQLTSELGQLRERLQNQETHGKLMKQLTVDEYEAKIQCLEHDKEILQEKLKSAEASEACIGVLDEDRKHLSQRLLKLLDHVEETDRKQAEEVYRLRANKDSISRAFETAFGTLLGKIMDQSEERAESQLSVNVKTKLAEYEKIKQSAEVAEEAAARLLHKCALVQKENRGLKLDVDTLAKSNENLLSRLAARRIRRRSFQAENTVTSDKRDTTSQNKTLAPRIPKSERPRSSTETKSVTKESTLKSPQVVYPSRVSLYDWTAGYIDIAEHSTASRLDNGEERNPLQSIIDTKKKALAEDYGNAMPINSARLSPGMRRTLAEVQQRLNPTGSSQRSILRPQSASSRFQQTAKTLSKHPVRRPQSSRRLMKK